MGRLTVGILDRVDPYRSYGSQNMTNRKWAQFSMKANQKRVTEYLYTAASDGRILKRANSKLKVFGHAEFIGEVYS